MTYSFINAIESEGMHTYGSLLNLMQSSIKDFEKKMETKRIYKLLGKLDRLMKMNQVNFNSCDQFLIMFLLNIKKLYEMMIDYVFW